MPFLAAFAIVLSVAGIFLLVIPTWNAGNWKPILASCMGIINGFALAFIDPYLHRTLFPGLAPASASWLVCLPLGFAPFTAGILLFRFIQEGLLGFFDAPKAALLEETKIKPAQNVPSTLPIEAIRRELENASARHGGSTFSVTMFSLDNALQSIQQEIHESMLRDDERLKRFYLTAKTFEEVTQIFGFSSLSQQLGRISTALARYLADLALTWNPLFLSQEIGDLRKTVRHYLRINSNLGHSLESAAEHWPSLKNFKHEDPITLCPEWKTAQAIALQSFHTSAWSDLESTVRVILEEKSPLRVSVSSSAPALAISFDDRQKLRESLLNLVANSTRHGVALNTASALKPQSAPQSKGEIRVIMRDEGDKGTITLRYNDDGRGLFVSGIQDGGEPLDMHEYAKRLFSPWRAPRGLATCVEQLAEIDAKASILLFTEELNQGYCPFAIDITLQRQRLRMQSENASELRASA